MIAPASPSSDPRRGLFPIRLARGAGYLVSSVRFVLRDHPSLRRTCLAPLAINLLLFFVAAALLFAFGGRILEWIWPRPDNTWLLVLWTLLWIVAAAGVLLLYALLFFSIQALLAAPFNDILSERVEELAFGRAAAPFSLGRLGRGLVRSMTHELGKQGVYLTIIGFLFLLKLVIPLLGVLLFVVGGFLLSALFFCYEYMDLCMERRDWAFGDKWRFLRRHQALALGFGGTLALLMMVPVLGALALPMAAVGGTRLFCELERAEAGNG